MSTNINTLETPALLLDLDKLESNMQFIVEKAKAYGVTYRPHIKTHKSIDIAKRQIEAGAIGLTVATVGEAEVMIDGGLKDIFIAYPISAPSKVQRAEKLLNRANLTLTVDSKEQAEMLGTYFTAANPVEVWIKVNSGLNRCGVEPKGEVLALAQEIQKIAGLHLTGLYTHAGQAYGQHAFAGEFGHTITHAFGRQCNCGLQGCYERYASTTALIQEALKVNPSFENGKVLFEYWHEGAPDAKQVITNWVDEIAIGLINLVHSFNPSTIIVGGGIMEQEVLIDMIKARVDAQMLPSFKEVEIIKASLGNQSGMLGGVSLHL